MASTKKRLRSGYCENGQHEGTKVLNYQSKPLPTCKWDKCQCECHEQIDQMFEASGMDRTVIDVSGYVPDLGDFVLPDVGFYADLTVPSNNDDTPGHPTLEDAPRPGSVTVAGHSFAPTPTGRRGRGQLEYQVLEECVQWLKAPDTEINMLTPKDISERIAQREKIAPPSVGAIQAVWDRWVKLEFASYYKKPVRFGGFNEDGTAQTLDRLKYKARHEKKSVKAALKRGVR